MPAPAASLHTRQSNDTRQQSYAAPPPYSVPPGPYVTVPRRGEYQQQAMAAVSRALKEQSDAKPMRMAYEQQEFEDLFATSSATHKPLPVTRNPRIQPTLCDARPSTAGGTNVKTNDNKHALLMSNLVFLRRVQAILSRRNNAVGQLSL
jgi:hypothetical protein